LEVDLPGRNVLVLSVDLRGRSDQDLLAVSLSGLQDGLGSQDVGLDDVNRILDHELHADRRRQVVDQIAFADQPVQHLFVENGVDGEVVAGVLSQALDVLETTGREVVDDDDVVAATEEGVGQMSADEAGAARDQRSSRWLRTRARALCR
jgi:hypothetical protein